MMLLVNNFTEFYYRKRSPTTEVSAEKIFDFDKYLAMSHEHNKSFMQEFIKTQAFTNFIESAYVELYLSSPDQRKEKKTDITCFQHGIKDILKHSFDTLLQKQWLKISSSLDRFSNPINVSVTECYFQYEVALRSSIRKAEEEHEDGDEPTILDHSKIVKMEKYKANRTKGVSPRQAQYTAPHHSKNNTINVTNRNNFIS